MSGKVVELKEETELEALLQGSKDNGSVLVLSFWADWHPPCKQMATVVKELASEKPAITFVQIEAENFQDVCERYPVESVPTFVVVQGGKVGEALEGANPSKLVALVNKVAKQAAASSTDASPSAKEELNARLRKLTHAAPVMLFMKGEPSNPKCKFSRETTTLLKEEGIRFGYFDILSDDEVRQGLKTYSNWKTYPQFYVNGELIGGLDVIKEMKEEGELQKLIPKESKKENIHAHLKQLINQSRVMLFMKGSPDNPQCGFSRTMTALLRECNFEFGHFDILLDNDVRQGLKEYSNWKTYPQLYVEGEFIGGLDVCSEMHQEGELVDLASIKA